MGNDAVSETSALSDADKEQRPLVSVGIITYNHEKFIGKAIESVLAQEVDFDYEIIIAEDCSTDRTREIVVEYSQRYPKLIKLILQEKNMGINGNSTSLRRACRGYFRAHLEGDDYWCDKKKLKRQVEFLIKNPEYVGIGGEFECYDEYGRKKAFPWGKISDIYASSNIYTVKDIQKWLLPAYASTLMYRNLFFGLDERIMKAYESAQAIGDRKMAAFLVCHGPIWRESKVVLHRRVLMNSKSSWSNVEKHLQNAQLIIYGWLSETEKMAKEGLSFNLDLSEKKEASWKTAIKRFGKTPSRENFKVAFGIFKASDCKAHYIKVAIVLLGKLIASKRKEGFGALIKSLFLFPIKAVKRAHLENRKNTVNRNNTVQKFLENNVSK